MENKERIMAALDAIPVKDLIREDWIRVGMALKHEGFDVSVWDDWSRSDTRYHAGECEKKWYGFKGASKPVTGATIIKMGIDRGMGWNYGSDNDSYGWDAEISEENEPVRSSKFTGENQLITYLKTLFKPEDYVGYVVESKLDEQSKEKGEEKYIPANAGNYKTKCKTLLKELSTSDIGGVLGDWNPKAGAWIRFNPLNGEGISDENVTRFDYALVECDSGMSVTEQEEAYRKLELPIAAMVYSGGKSVHAIVRIDAPNEAEYETRVKFLHDYLMDHGIPLDRQNKNPSRLSRMPGVTRGNQKQNLIAVNIGRKSWIDWMEFVEENDDPLPELESLASVYDDPPKLPPEIIEGVLRQGHKMLISGSSKAGKSFLLIELAVAISEGRQWLRFKCKQGKVLYINLEIDRPSFIKRILHAYEAMKITPRNPGNIVMWNLRGHAIPLDKLVPRLVRRIKNEGYDAIIVDPIYKIIIGDENKASDMGAFCNCFDKICDETGCSVIYCHHHSKGNQGFKKAQDRASGSGVFARDPDAILDIIEMDLGYDDDGNSAFVSGHGEGSVWRLEGSLREFAGFEPVLFRFIHPIHELLEGEDLDAAKKLYPIGDPRCNLKINPTSEQQMASIHDAYDELETFGTSPIRVSDISEIAGMSEKTVREYLKRMSTYIYPEHKDNGKKYSGRVYKYTNNKGVVLRESENPKPR